MNRTVRIAVLPVAFALLYACSSPGPDSPQPIPEPATAPVAAAPVTTSLTVYKSLGRRQCEEGGETAESLAAQLRTAGIEVRAVGCGTDGMMYAAVCGGGTGDLGVFDIAAGDAERAAAAGFKPLTDLPDAQRTACPGADAKQSMK